MSAAGMHSFAHHLDWATLSSQCLISFLFITCIRGADVRAQHVGQLQSGFHIFFSVSPQFCVKTDIHYLSCWYLCSHRVCYSTLFLFVNSLIMHEWLLGFVSISEYILHVGFYLSWYPRRVWFAIVGCALKSMFDHYKWVLYMVPPGGLMAFLHVHLEPLKC